jgi:hypothetical protein
MQACFIEGLHRLCPHCVCRHTFEQKRVRLNAFQLPTADCGCTPAILIWKNSKYAIPTAIATFSIHAIVTLLLLTVFRDTVAANSIGAMIFRLVTWLIILALIFAQSRRQKTQ